MLLCQRQCQIRYLTLNSLPTAVHISANPTIQRHRLPCDIPIDKAVQMAIRGRDAFFPPDDPSPHDWQAVIETALATDHLLDLTYQGLVDDQPGQRRVEPVRIEARSGLLYLHAYCHVAEANRIFRLDRIQACRLVPDSAQDKRMALPVDEWFV